MSNGPIITFGRWSKQDQLNFASQRMQDIAEHPEMDPLVFIQAALVAACWYADENGVSREQLVHVFRQAKLPEGGSLVWTPPSMQDDE